jgi:hypothetical protein
MYFEKFPITFYSLDNLETVQLVRNIFLRLSINQNIKENLSLYDEYDVLDGETPEIVADKFYKNPQYHWLILHMNEILDPRFDWPLSQNNLVKYAQSKYTNIYGIHHYVDSNGFIVNSTQVGATSVSNFDHEDTLNEKKRRIKVLKSQYVEAVNREFTNKLENING